jgi:hypothetical protein
MQALSLPCSGKTNGKRSLHFSAEQDDSPCKAAAIRLGPFQAFGKLQIGKEIGPRLISSKIPVSWP